MIDFLQDDFYVWKNPRINDKQVRDALENRLKTLTDQLRVMEKVLGEREAEIEFLYGQQQTMIEGADAPLAQSLGSSGTFSSPMQSPKIINGPTKYVIPRVFFLHSISNRSLQVSRHVYERTELDEITHDLSCFLPLSPQEEMVELLLLRHPQRQLGRLQRQSALPSLPHDPRPSAAGPSDHGERVRIMIE